MERHLGDAEAGQHREDLAELRFVAVDQGEGEALGQHRPGVLRYLQMVAQMAPRVMDFPLQPAVESGNAFQPVGPEDLPASTAGDDAPMRARP
jgi:hypothetical protein